MRECIIPEPALRDQDSVEMIRVWIAEKGLHCTINVGMYEKHRVPEAEAWGMILADVTRHVADALRTRHGTDVAVTVDRIRESYLTELDSPTSETKGGFAPSKH
ncbi:MAG TPA: DUF5076 domain-containing protein [Dongiaceae bacterium]